MQNTKTSTKIHVMAVNIGTHFLHTTLSVPSLLPSLPPTTWPSSSSPILRIRISASSSSSSSPSMDPLTKFKELPFVSAPQRDLMLDLLSSVETRLGSSLLPCSLPPDVQYYQNQSGTAQGSLYIGSGVPSSPVDFILGNWLHCKLPTGGTINITSLSGYLKPLTDAPNFLFELIQSSPTSFVLILDLPPRKDLVLYPEYLKTFYEDTELDRHRQLLEKLAEVRPYFSSSLYIRAIVSPSAILVHIEAEAGETARVEEIIRDHVSPITKEMMKIWLDLCVCIEREMAEADMSYLAKRDQIIKNKTIEIDIGSNFPRLFGQEVADRVLGVLREIYNA